MKKRVLSVLITILTVCVLAFTLTACGKQPVEEQPASEGLEYTLNEDGESYCLTGIGTCTDTDIVIPNTYNGKPVTSIGNGAFWRIISDRLTDNRGSLTSVIIPDSVTSIENVAFFGYSSLMSIKVDENNTAYKSIDGNLYSKDGTELIQYAIGKTATEFIIPDSVTSIGRAAFGCCRSLTSVTIPDGVTSIGSNAFYNCSGLTSIVIPDSVMSIGGYAFEGCSSLTSVTIGDSVTSIGGYAFDGCSSLTSVTIGDSVTSIGDRAFGGCSSLTSITIPDSVTSIGRSAFGGCDSLTAVYYNGTKEDWNKISIDVWGNSYLTDATRYYYSESQPEGSGNYWHYVDGEPKAW